MGVDSNYETTFQLDHRHYRAAMHAEQRQIDGRAYYKAVIDSSPLRGTHSAEEDSVESALDYLNLAMQAEGADEIIFTALPTEATG